MSDQQVLQKLEQYYDAVPRLSARAEDFGPLTLFVRDDGGHPYYARPTPGRPEPVTVEQVEAVRARQRELGIPESFEWVAETTPGLKAAVAESGLQIEECPLLVLTAEPTLVPETTARILEADSPALSSAIAVQHLAFATAGTAPGAAGFAELAEEIAKVAAADEIARAQGRLRSQATVFAAVIEQEVAVSAGQHNPVGNVTEIVGVGTLPVARRRGFGAAVTAALAEEARSRGVETIFLSAADEDVARIYGRLGFRRVGTAMIVG